MAVYIIEAQQFNRVKIGFTDNDDISARLRSLRTGCPGPMTVRYIWKGAPKTFETILHRTFKESRITGEWFYLCAGIKDLLQKAEHSDPAWDELEKEYWANMLDQRKKTQTEKKRKESVLPPPPAPELTRMLYDKAEAARQLSISLRSFNYLIANKEINFRRVGRRVLISRGELLRFAAKNHYDSVRR